MLTMRVTPKMSDSPAPTKNRPDGGGEPVERLEHDGVEGHAAKCRPVGPSESEKVKTSS